MIEINKYIILFLGMVLYQQVFAAPAPPLSQLPPIVPLHQEMTAVDYFREGSQIGCGLRITGESQENVWLNVLISVFQKETGVTFGREFKFEVQRLT